MEDSLVEPVRSEYASYSNYACAVVGYYFLLGNRSAAAGSCAGACVLPTAFGCGGSCAVGSVVGHPTSRAGCCTGGSGVGADVVDDVGCAGSHAGHHGGSPVADDGDVHVDSVDVLELGDVGRGGSRGRSGDVGSIVQHAVVPTLPRGRHFERNRANRLRKKAAKAAKAAGLTCVGAQPSGAKVGRFDGLEDEVKQRLLKSQAERYIMENEARVEELKARELRRQDGSADVHEIVRLLRAAKECEGYRDVEPGAGRVAGWVQAVATSASESVMSRSPVGSVRPSRTGSAAPNVRISRSESYGASVVPSRPVSANSSVSVASLKLEVTPPNEFEQILMFQNVIVKSDLHALRKKRGRVLDMNDVVGTDRMFKLTGEKLLSIVLNLQK